MKEITVLIKEKDLKTLKSILEFLKEKFPSFAVFRFRTGKLGEELVVSFKVNPIFYPTVLEKFAYNDIPVILKDIKSKNFIEEKKAQKNKNLIPLAQLWSDVKTQNKSISLHELEKFAVNGKYKEVIKASKSVPGAKQEVIVKAQNILSDTVRIAVDNIYESAKGKKLYFERAYETLIAIATDKDLKNLRKFDEIISAGLAAIELCTFHKENVEKLIEIANNSNLSNIVNVKSSVKFSELIFADEELYSDELNKAVKFLNTKWLRIAIDGIRQKLSSEEENRFNSLIDLVENRRNL